MPSLVDSYSIAVPGTWCGFQIQYISTISTQLFIKSLTCRIWQQPSSRRAQSTCPSRPAAAQPHLGSYLALQFGSQQVPGILRGYLLLGRFISVAIGESTRRQIPGTKASTVRVHAGRLAWGAGDRAESGADSRALTLWFSSGPKGAITQHGRCTEEGTST